MPIILLVGEDEGLLHSRMALLTRTQAEVLATDTSDLVRTVADKTIDLVILCHSLWPGVRPLISADVRQRWPGVQVIQVLKYHSEAAAEYADHVVFAGEPATLLAKVTELLTTSPCGHAKRALPSNQETGRPKLQAD
ncbi:MAG TPA: hypothetical protein VHU44_18905 [Acidobacteriaceae bacterium]|jgi:hypothetical protein|nr:hypothetical protein [Acidobacteriaceae bacterium]